MSIAPETSVLVETQGAVTIVTINRPHRRNAVDGLTARLLFEAFQAFDADPTAAVAVFTGTGDAFCAGADLKALAMGDREKMREIGDRVGRTYGATREYLSQCRRRLAPFIAHCLPLLQG